mmetsp:Transcript_1252/g.3670  ORF Transcript_1252/g.3670 Transcript_1252/m.3670 type:complete len:219 (+) Transcript_1252:1634-2290(+)
MQRGHLPDPPPTGMALEGCAGRSCPSGRWAARSSVPYCGGRHSPRVTGDRVQAVAAASTEAGSGAAGGLEALETPHALCPRRLQSLQGRRVVPARMGPPAAWESGGAAMATPQRSAWTTAITWPAAAPARPTRMRPWAAATCLAPPPLARPAGRWANAWALTADSVAVAVPVVRPRSAQRTAPVRAGRPRCPPRRWRWRRRTMSQGPGRPMAVRSSAG